MAPCLTTVSPPKRPRPPGLLADAIKFAGGADEQGAVGDRVGGQGPLAERVAGQLLEGPPGLQDGADAVLGLEIQLAVGEDRRGGVASAARALLPVFAA